MQGENGHLSTNEPEYEANGELMSELTPNFMSKMSSSSLLSDSSKLNSHFHNRRLRSLANDVKADMLEMAKAREIGDFNTTSKTYIKTFYMAQESLESFFPLSSCELWERFETDIRKARNLYSPKRITLFWNDLKYFRCL